MYISSIRIKNVRCLGEIEIDFENNEYSFRSILLTGDNASGKTTILRCIALALAGKSSAQGLADEIDGDWIKSGADQAHIEVELRSYPSNKIYKIKTSFSKRNGNTLIDQEGSENFPSEKIFACGYGASRSVLGSDSYSDYTVVDAVYTLFNPDATLQNPEVAIRRAKDYGNLKESDILRSFEKILMLHEGKIRLTARGILVRGVWGESVPIGALADGHHSIITLIGDLLGWATLRYKEDLKTDISGIVMIDEIEQHLHPKWQKEIILLLKKTFPKVQFIVTTHSPVVAGNVVELQNQNNALKIFHLERTEERNIGVSKVDEALADLDYDQILSSEAFDYITNLNGELNDILKRASQLAGKDNRNKEEERKYQECKAILKKLKFSEGRTLIERMSEEEYYEELTRKIDEFRKILGS